VVAGSRGSPGRPWPRPSRSAGIVQYL
jgi:hypothetical protein